MLKLLPLRSALRFPSLEFGCDSIRPAFQQSVNSLGIRMSESTQLVVLVKPEYVNTVIITDQNVLPVSCERISAMRRLGTIFRSEVVAAVERVAKAQRLAGPFHRG